MGCRSRFFCALCSAFSLLARGFSPRCVRSPQSENCALKIGHPKSDRRLQHCPLQALNSQPSALNSDPTLISQLDPRTQRSPRLREDAEDFLAPNQGALFRPRSAARRPPDARFHALNSQRSTLYSTPTLNSKSPSSAASPTGERLVGTPDQSQIRLNTEPTRGEPRSEKPARFVLRRKPSAPEGRETCGRSSPACHSELSEESTAALTGNRPRFGTALVFSLKPGTQESDDRLGAGSAETASGSCLRTLI